MFIKKEKEMSDAEFSEWFGRRSFVIARFSYYYLEELIYWSLDHKMGRELADALYCNNDGSRARGFEYGFFPIDKVREDINNPHTNHILGFECKPGLSKLVIAHQFNNKNLPKFEGNRFSIAGYYAEKFEGLVRKHNSVILALMNVCIALEKENACLTA